MSLISKIRNLFRRKPQICEYAREIELRNGGIRYECTAPAEHVCNDKKRIGYCVYSCRKHNSED